MSRLNVKELALELARANGSVRSGELVAASGRSRQAVHANIVSLCKAGLLVRRGAGRSTHYVLGALAERELGLELVGLDEAVVWRDLSDKPPLSELGTLGRSGFAYAFTELLNNAIDHSRGSSVKVRYGQRDETIWFSIEDDGLGALASVMNKFGLASPLEAVQEIAKGKTTTAPERHSGEGLFFVSKLADRFSLESQELRWSVDNVRHDTATGSSPRAIGTKVTFEAVPANMSSLSDLFSTYTTELTFDKTQIVVKLFEMGDSFISRSEAKRLMHNLDRFRYVILDFTGIEQVGQGFVDEVFRVWRNRHPEVDITAINAEPAVAWMIERGRAQRA